MVKDSRIKPCRQCWGGHAGCKVDLLPDGKTQPQMLLAMSRGGSGSVPRWHFCPMSHWHERSGLHGKDPPACCSGGRLRQAGPQFPAKRGLIEYSRAFCHVNVSKQPLRAGSSQKAERNGGKCAVFRARSSPRAYKRGHAGPCLSWGPRGQEQRSRTTSSASCC